MPEEKKRKKGGPPRFQVTTEMIVQVGILSGQGMTQEQISDYFGINRNFYYKLKKRHPELEEAYTVGKAKMIALASGKLIELVMKGNPTAVIFYLKTQARFREVDRPEDQEESGRKNRPAITLNVNDPIEAARIYQKYMMES